MPAGGPLHEVELADGLACRLQLVPIDQAERGKAGIRGPLKSHDHGQEDRPQVRRQKATKKAARRRLLQKSRPSAAKSANKGKRPRRRRLQELPRRSLRPRKPGEEGLPLRRSPKKALRKGCTQEGVKALKKGRPKKVAKKAPAKKAAPKKGRQKAPCQRRLPQKGQEGSCEEGRHQEGRQEGPLSRRPLPRKPPKAQ